MTENPDDFAYRNVMVTFVSHVRSGNCDIFLEDSLSAVRPGGILYLHLRNQVNSKVAVPAKSIIGKAFLVKTVFEPITNTGSTEAATILNIYQDFCSKTSSETLSSSNHNQFPSSTEPSEAPLSESEVRKRTDPELLKPIKGPDLSAVASTWGESIKSRLEKLLFEFDDLFMKHKADIGRCKIAKHRIEALPDAIPHREGARRMSPDKAEKANAEVNNLLALGMIQPSFSPWASGIVMVKKKGGELRFCCDFRPLNEVTIKDAYPLPRIDESLSRIGNAKCFTSIDLAWAFWQIPVKKAHRHRTAFACELGLFEWRRMPFGLCNASPTFQRAIARALAKIVQRHGSMVMAYIDDIVIATETVEDHLERLREVFQCLREAGFKMRAAKCSFMRNETKYLGRIVSAEGIKPDPEAIEKVRDWIAPRNREEL